MKNIGITTTVPIEVLIAAGYRVIDLNNIFVTASNYSKYIDIAERDGFPKSLCAFIKGIYGACVENNINEVVGVIGGDCSNTKALVDVMKSKGVKIYPFSYPHYRNIKEVRTSIDNFMDIFNVKHTDVELIRAGLKYLRGAIREVDRLTYTTGQVSGFENHLYQVSMSDFDGDVNKYSQLVKDKLKEFNNRAPQSRKLRLGFIGVPPMTADIYNYVEDFESQFVYNEVQREFAFPRFEEASNIYEQYYDYTYPYDIEFRVSEIKKQVKKRKIDGIIHYTQAFCHRAIEDIIIKEKLDIPVLNIEGDKLTSLDARTKLRIEAFLDMLLDSKEMSL